MKKSLLLLLVLSVSVTVRSQDLNFEKYPATSVGPVVQGARIVDIAVNPNNSHQYYIGFASGGVFKTINNGVTFFPVFDEQGSLTIGDIAIAPSESSIIYVGTGENNSSRSSYAGDGVYKSVDKGASWVNVGLKGTQHIGRIVVHPTNPDIVWVAAMGGLYSKNEERGVFKTIDGGDNWEKVLFVNDQTGAIDLIIDPTNANVLYASMWERRRYAWDFIGNGPGSGLYKSFDGGVSWSKSMSGIPSDDFTGRIGLDISAEDSNVLYAVLDYQKETKKAVEAKKADLSLADISGMSVDQFLNVSNDRLDQLLKEKGFPKKYNATTVKKEIRNGDYSPAAIANYFGNANDALFNTTVAGTILYKSIDAGLTWNRTHPYNLEGVFYTYGYYFGEVRISPQDQEEVFILGVPLIKSSDGGKTFARTDTIGNVHSDHQSMWINPKNDDHIILGNDGGLYISYDGGATWDHRNNMSVGQFYTVNVDMEDPYNIYGGLQDNGTLVGSSKTIPGVRGQWERLFGGDGMYVSADPRNADIVYVGYQFGNYYRLNRGNGVSSYITPSHNIGEEQLRFNWRTPVLMSTHNPDILYMGSQKVHRSLNQGLSWEEMSNDLSKGAKEGNVPFGTITEIAESTFKFGLLYAGTDDGNIWRYTTKNGWVSIQSELPSGLWVSSLHPSVHEEGTIYLTLTGYRSDDFNSYVYKSINYGNSWEPINANMKEEAINVIYEDHIVPDLLYLGTDNGTYISMNGGGYWERLHAIPNVASYDMVIHPREQELIVGTHGRSVFVVDVKPFQKIAKSVKTDKFVTFDLEKVRFSEDWGKKRYPYLDAHYPEIKFPVFFKDEVEKLEIIVKNEKGKVIKSINCKIKGTGYHLYTWDGQLSQENESFIQQGKYTVVYKIGKQEVVDILEVK